jgi:AcrR family transcriptional regulator
MQHNEEKRCEMGASERKDREKQMRRNDIIDAAEKLFFSKGYEATTMDDVASEAEFSKRTVYTYFNSKEQLYFEIMVRGYRIMLEMLSEALAEDTGIDGIRKIRIFGRTLYQFNLNHPEYFDAIMCYENGEKDFTHGVPDASREECYRLGEELFALLSSSVAQGIEEGLIRNDLDVTDTAIILWSCSVGLFNTTIKKRNYIEHYHKRTPEKLLLDGLDMLIHSIQ